jgi:Fe2+ transport system protein FeoA
MLKSVQLEELRPGQIAEISQLIGESSAVTRMYEIGLRVGASLEMLQRGRASVVKVNGSKLCLRSNGVQVLVRPG